MKTPWIVAALLHALASVSTTAETLPICPKEDSKNTVYGAECGMVTLAENPGASASPVSTDHKAVTQNETLKQIDIYTLRLPSIRDSVKPAIFFIAGGPGQASTDLAEQFRYQFKDLLVEHDFVFVDQRGTGKSNALECDMDFMPYLDKSTEQLEQLSLEVSKDCLEKNDSDLRYYTTPYAVQDLEAIRNYLGYEKIFLWGGSYGTRVVLEYLRSFPDALAGVVMDGLAPVAIALPNHTEQDANAALDKLLSHCESSDVCAKSFPQLRAHWLEALDGLAAQPQFVDLQHPRSGERHRVYIDDITLSSWLRLVLYSRDVVALVPLMMHQSAQGDYSSLFSIVSMSYENINKQFSELMQSTVLCAEDNQYDNSLSTSPPATQTLLRLPAKDNFEKLCELFPKGHIEEGYFKLQQRDVPSLLLSGHYDPVTPARWAEFSAKALTRSQHIHVPGGHHIVSGLGCVNDIIKMFVETPGSIGSLDVGCVEKIKPAHFFIDSAGPAMELKHD